MKKVFYLLSMFSFLFFAACSSDDDNGSGNPDNGGEDGFTEISLEASANEIEIGESITFTVIADEGEDVTAMASIDVDGNVLESNTFVAEEVGNFEATAVLDELTSNSVGFVVNEDDDDDNGDDDDAFVVETDDFIIVFWGGVQPGGEGTEIFGFFSMINFNSNGAEQISQEVLDNSEIFSDVEVLMPLNSEGELQIPGESATDPSFLDLFELRVEGSSEIEIIEGSSEGVVVVSDLTLPTEAGDPSFIDYQADVTFNSDNSLDASYQGEWFFADASSQEGEAQRPATDLENLKVENVETLETLIAKKNAFLNK